MYKDHKIKLNSEAQGLEEEVKKKKKKKNENKG